MRFFCLTLLIILLGLFGNVLRALFRQTRGLSPLLGWMVGLAYFVLAPLTLMTLNGGLELPDSYQVGQQWAAVDLGNPAFLLPYLVVWFLLMSTCLIVYVSLPAMIRPTAKEWTCSSRKLERPLLITMGVSLAT